MQRNPSAHIPPHPDTEVRVHHARPTLAVPEVPPTPHDIAFFLWCGYVSALFLGVLIGALFF